MWAVLMTGPVTGPMFSAIRRPMDNVSPQSCSACGPWWRLPLLLVLVLVAIVWSRSRGIRQAEPDVKEDRPAEAAEPAEHERVSLEIDFGDGRPKDPKLFDWRDGMTVADLFATTPEATIVQQGSGASAFLSSIDGVKNEGAGRKNWTYSVNGKSADRSFAIYRLQPGDRVLWTFGREQ